MMRKFAPLLFFTITTLTLSATRFGKIPYYERWDTIEYLEGEFFLVNTETIPDNNTKIKIAYDKDFLYVKAVCYEGRIKGLIESYTGGDIWKNDCIEVFIDTEINRKRYYHFIVSVDGQMYGRNSEVETVSGWTAATKKGEDRWEADIKIPFSLLGITPVRGNVLFMSFCRERWADGPQFSTWTPPRGFHRPEDFGVIVIGDYKDALTFYLKGVQEKVKTVYDENKTNNLPKNISEKIQLWEDVIEKGKTLKSAEYVREKDFEDWWLIYEKVKSTVNLEEVVDEIRIENLLFGSSSQK